jgi:hypothetical protein
MDSPSAISVTLFWSGAVACAVAQVAVLRAVLMRSPGTPPATGAMAAGTGGSGSGRVREGHRSREVVWALIPAIALATVFYWTWTAIHNEPPTASPVSRTAPAQGVST